VSTAPVKLGTPTAGRFDFANNLYIADGGAGTNPVPQVIMIPGEPYDTPITPSLLLSGSQVSYPQALAVDNTGNNLYIGDGDLNSIIQVALGTGTVTTLPISPCDATTVTSCAFNSPAGIAFDPNGDMYVTDSGQRVLMIPANHSASFPTVQLPITGLNNPTGITLDGSGNVYVTDLNTSVVKLLVNSGKVKVGTSATTRITNTGNQNLSITALTFGNGSSSFAQTNNCTSASIAPGSSCTITFTNPRNVASDTLTITSNAYSPAGVKIALTQ
jgi:streptogramin lyase